MLTLRALIHENSKISCTVGIAPEWKLVEHAHCHEYQGVFAVYGKAGMLLVQIPGRVIDWVNLPADLYIYNPPPSLRMHRHGRCLQLVTPNGGWFKLHWEKPAQTFDEARAYVENMIFEVLQRN